MEECSALKRIEIVTHATTYMSIENIMLSETSDTKGQILYGFIGVRYSEYVNSQSQKAESRVQGLEEGRGCHILQ